MVVVKAGKFTMCIIAFAISGDDKAFKGITGVEGSNQEFKDLNKLLKRHPAFPPFNLSDMREERER